MRENIDWIKTWGGRITVVLAMHYRKCCYIYQNIFILQMMCSSNFIVKISTISYKWVKLYSLAKNYSSLHSKLKTLLESVSRMNGWHAANLSFSLRPSRKRIVQLNLFMLYVDFFYLIETLLTVSTILFLTELFCQLQVFEA